MASSNSTSDKEVFKGPKPDDLDIIANLMDNILINMKSQVHNIKKNKINDISSSSASPNLTSETRHGMISVIQKALNKNMKSPISEKDEANSKDQKIVNLTKRRAHSALHNTQKKTVSNKKDESTKSRISNDVQIKKRKQHSAKPFSKKIKVVYKENETFVSKSLSSMLKKKNAPKICTVPIVNNPITDNKWSTKSLSAKTGNIAYDPLQHSRMNFSRTQSTVGSNISSKTPKTYQQNSVDIILEKHFKGRNENKSNKKKLERASLYVTPKEFMEKHIHRNSNMLRPIINQFETRPSSRMSVNRKRTVSLNAKSCPNRKLATGTHNRNIQNQNVNNKRPHQEKSKSFYEVRKPQNTNNDIRSTFQNEKKLNDDKENQIPGPSTSQPNKSVSLDTNQILKTIPFNQSNITSTSLNLKQTAPLKFIKNKEKPKIQTENNKKPTTTETDIKKPKTDNEIKNDSQCENGSNLNEMGDCSVKLINEKIQDVIDNIHEDKDNSKLNLCKTNSTKASVSQQNEKKPVNKNPSTTIAKPFLDTNNTKVNKINNKRNIKGEQPDNTKKSSTNNQQKSINVKPSEVITKGVIKPSVQSLNKINDKRNVKLEQPDNTKKNNTNNQEKSNISVKPPEVIPKEVSKLSVESLNKINNKPNVKLEQPDNTKKSSTNNQQKNSSSVKPSEVIPKEVTKPSVESLNKINNKRNVKLEQPDNTKKSSTNNQQKNSSSVKPPEVIPKKVSKQSVQSVNKINNKRNVKLEQPDKTKNSSTNNQQKNSSSVKPPAVIPKGASKQSVQSSAVPKSNNMLCIRPSRKLSTLTPMEIVQDFVNLVNRAKRDRKTYTVCGNYYSVRRAFAERGWLEKLRINLISDRESWRKLETLTNFELVEGIKDKENGDKYRRVFISKLLAGHQVDFYWDYMTNPFNVNNDKIKRTIINRFPFGSTRSYTSKAGLCESLKDAHWYFVEGHSNILFPRTYNLAYDEEIKSFIDDFRLTAVISLLKWILKYSHKPTSIMSPSGQIPTSVFNFATMQCYNYIKIKEHKDLDDIIPVTKEYEWDIFLEKFYKIVHQGAHFKENECITAPLIIDQAKYILNKMQKYLPRIEKEGNMNLWLLKPNNGSRGCGIHVCRTLKYTLDMVSMRKETKYVIQKYIERPLLIHNTKFDIRQWFLVTCMPNLHVWLYKDCYLRFSSQMYDLSKLHESIHLTNNSIQCRYKNNALRNPALPDQNMWHSDTFRKYLTEIGQPYAWKNLIYKGIKECLVGLFMLCQDRLLTRVNSFELCGADFMVTEDFRPYLIEINSRPALYPSTRVTATMCPRVLEDVVRVTVDYARNPRAGTGNFELIYKDTFSYIPPKNVSSLFIDGISYVKYATDAKAKVKHVESRFEKIPIKSLEKGTGSIQKILKIDPTKVRKDVKNTLEKILAIIHSEQNAKDTSDDKNKQFRMMLLDFVDIISSVKNNKQTE